MNEPNPNAPVPQEPSRYTRASAWIRRRRNAILSSALRGSAYSSGGGAVGLIFWWIRHHV
ncbi:hypothetical protein SHJG_p1165 (plasmid) [Streptomyces hygroscopicus subsp. jinggangensis 5008]|nr:hypothetical protein SHJG_p1165 [Streptomyces hygroscopicus subsp. jinggangensis 5008]AGF68450.1 hypothetical protein SHJGH_p1165 [Streptomyces hygroscopicus subsp. jinggangensis TL01]